MTNFALWLAALLREGTAPYEVLDGTARPPPLHQSPGAWPADRASRNWQEHAAGWYDGLLCTAPSGPITGWGVGPASTNERTSAETFCAVRAAPQLGLPTLGHLASAVYVADIGLPTPHVRRAVSRGTMPKW